MRETETGIITINSVKGNNSVIKRKSGEEIKLEPSEKLTFSEFYDKMSKIKIKDGDTFITGARSAITVSSTWDSGKTEPTEDSMLKYKLENSMGLTLAPDSKARLSTTSWSKINEERRMRTHGKGVTKVELIKGIFQARVKNAVELVTPTAVFEKPDAKTTEIGGTIEVLKDGTTYVAELGKLKIKNRKTGKTYLAKPYFGSWPGETIITEGSIFRKSFTEVGMDERISLVQRVVGACAGSPGYEAKDSVEMWSDMAARSVAPPEGEHPLKDPESFMKKMMAAGEMVSQMTPEDLEKFKEFGMTDEQLKDLKASLKEAKQQDKGKSMEEMKKVTKELKAVQAEREQIYKDFTPEHMEKFKEVTKYSMQKTKEDMKKAWKDAMKTYESLPKYPPLEAKFKVA